ncbi:phage integrase SAM-like domain-containing protein [Marinifilum sp. D714]|uniref:tyrosine-type recombinase/integrase n=1 Tax=Marinifilum sp. D714 TaxID=2937523 RepID=UPI0027CF1D76|nr:phage integrase SAM-like domain-containing protein [Marinifilum sp. D714]MDQ2178806.1 phage integrase SAM-like domain-containing protein [Marinifilum sp. D714]
MYFFLKEPKSDKLTPIYLIYYLKSQKKNFKYSTNQTIHPDNWNSESRMPKAKRGASGAELKHTSSMLSMYSDFLDEKVKELDKQNTPITRELLKQLFDEEFKHKSTKQESRFLTEAIQDFIDTKGKSNGQSDSWNQKYTNLKNKLIAFEDKKRKKIEFTSITQDWIDEFCGFLRIIKVKPFKPHNDNTLHRTINFLITVLIWSEGKYHNIDLKKIKNPVNKYQPDDVFLTDKEIQVLEKFQFPRESLERARDLFLIGVYSGQRYSDYSIFEKADIHGDMIIKKAEKTESESFIPLHPKLKALLDKYDWQLPKISNQKFNKRIQEACKLAGFDEKIKEIIYSGTKKEIVYNLKYKMISSHTARRTFITLSSEKGMPDHIIMKITGIKDPKTLIKYKKTSQKSVVDSMQKYWG